MSHDLMGFIEEKPPYEGSEWTYAGEVHSLLGHPWGYTGILKEFIIGFNYGRYIGPICGDEVFPDDLHDQTKLNMMFGHTDNPNVENFNECFHKDSRNKITVKLSELNSFNWNKKISDNSIERIRKDIREDDIGDYAFRNVLKYYFSLVDSDGETLDFEKTSMSLEKEKSLLLEGETDYKGQTLTLEKKPLRESINESWFQLLDLMYSSYKSSVTPSEIRFIFYLEY